MFFFFNQNTAYELGISDWSSDVCSSDLGSPLIQANDTNTCSCPAGTTLQVLIDKFECQACPEGTYREAFSENGCVACTGEYMTTKADQSTSAADCVCRNEFVAQDDGTCTCP